MENNSSRIAPSGHEIPREKKSGCLKLRGRTTLEKSLIVFSVLATITTLVFLITFAVTYTSILHGDEIKRGRHESNCQPVAFEKWSSERSTEVEDNICTTEVCISASSRISAQIDNNVEPCDDFYQFTCGSWIEKNVIPSDVGGINMFSVLRDDVEVTLKNALEKESTKDINAIKSIKDLYASCLNTSAMEDKGTEPLRELLVKNGAWPVIDTVWIESNFKIVPTLVKLQAINLDPIINMFVSTDFKDSSKRVIYIDQPSFGMPGRDYFLRGRDDVMLKAYEEYGINLAVEMGTDRLAAEADFKDLVDFEIQLANVSVPAEDRRDGEALYNPYTIANLSVAYPNFNWLEYFSDIFNMNGVDITLTEDEVIINRSPPYFDKLFPLLENTSNRVLANYALYHLVLDRAKILTDLFRDISQDYETVLSGTASARDRFRTCVSYVQNHAGHGVGRLFIDENFDEASKLTAQEMIENLRQAFFELLTELDWMDSDTRELARVKAEYINEKIGYPEYILNNTYLEEYYKDYNYGKDTYFDNYSGDQERKVVENLKDLRNGVSKYDWSLNAATVNAFYSPQKNQIMFPAGILQPPFFNKDYPKALNYGGIGVVIGHEITHGFDDSGRQYDKDGNLLQWWSDDAIDQFKAKAQCIIDQYSTYILPEANMNVNGINTQGENIADNGGLKQSYRAYKNVIAKEGEEARLPGLKYNNNQLFFINFGQIWCNKVREEAAIRQILTGVHSPPNLRVIGSVQNSKDFSDVFGCSSSTNMNPENKCYVW